MSDVSSYPMTTTQVAALLKRSRVSVEWHARVKGRGYKKPGGRDWLFDFEHVEAIRNSPPPGHPFTKNPRPV